MKILFFVEGKKSLGHINRSIELAKSILKYDGNNELFFIINSDFTFPFEENNFEYIKVESSDIDINTVGGNLPERYNHYLKSILLREMPDIITFDSFFPQRLLKNDEFKKIKKVLVLRKYKDMEMQTFFNNDFDKLFDLILVPHYREEFSNYERRYSKKFGKLQFVGPITKEIEGSKVKKVKNKSFKIVAICGGGGFDDAEKFVNCNLKICNTIRGKVKNLDYKIITGPFYKNYDLVKKSENKSLKIKDYEDDIIPLMVEADLIVSQAGYNTINEIFLTKTPAILMPGFRNNDDQQERARNLQKYGVAYVINDYDTHKACKIIQDLYFNRKKLKTLQRNFDKIKFERGNEKAAREILDLLKEKKYRLKISNKCNNNCIFCNYLNIKEDYDKSLEEIKKELNNLKERNYSQIILPCNTDIREDFFGILEYAKNLGFRITLETNGRIFYYKDFLRKVVECVDKFEIFINGSRDIHNRVCSTDSFVQTIKGIKNLLGLGVHIQINTVITNNNYKNLKEIVSLIKELGAQNWRPMFPVVKEKNKNIPEVIDCFQYIDEAIKFAKSIGLNVITSELFNNPFIPRDLNLDYKTAELKYEKILHDSRRNASKRIKTVVWELTNVCNYGCSYCGPKKKIVGKVRIDNYKTVIDQLKKLEGTWDIQIYGGEPLIVENLSDILSAILKETNHKIFIVTNLSPNTQQIMKTLDLPPKRVGYIAASFHTEFCDEKSFFIKACEIHNFLKKKGIKFYVCSVALKEKLDYLHKLGKKFRKAGLDFVLQPKREGKGFAKYSAKEKKIVQEFGRTFGLDCVNFKDKICYAGMEYFVLDAYGDTYRCDSARRLGVCSRDYLGNIHERTFKLCNKPQKCTYDCCCCILPYATSLIVDESDGITKKEVSIIIPTYNRKDLLELTLISLFYQNYPKEKYEIIVVDDGSNDDTFEMVKKLKPTCNFKYIYWPRNKPYKFGEPGNRTGPARNLGVNHSDGEIILFWDSDMIADSNMLKEQMKAFNKNISVLGIRKNLKKNFIEKKKIMKSLKNNTFKVSDTDLGEDVRIGKLLKEQNYDIMGYEQPWFFWISNNVLIAKKIFQEAGGFDNNFVFWGDEDQELGYRLYKKRINFKVNKKAIGYHQHHEDECVNKELFYKNKNNHKNIFYKKHLEGGIFEFYKGFFEEKKVQESKRYYSTKSTVINLTNLCNLNCSMCFDTIEDRKEKKELSFREIKKLLDSLKEIGIKRINFSGGEPTLRRDLFEIIDYTKKLNFVTNINTNGYFGEEVIQKLLHSEIDKVVFSLDFCDEELNDKIRGKKGSFKNVLKNIKKLRELRILHNKTIKIYVQCVFMGINLHGIMDLVNFIYNLGVDGVIFQAINPFEGFLDNNKIIKKNRSHIDLQRLWINPKQYQLLDSTIDKLIKFKKKNGFIINSINYLLLLKGYFRKPSLSKLGMECMGENYFAVNYDGGVMPCWGVDWNVGNIKDKPLKDILTSDKFTEAKKIMKSCDIPCLLMCYEKCNE